MIDRIELLEEKIAALLQKIHDTKSRIGELQRSNRELAALLEQKDQTDSDNSRLQARIQELPELPLAIVRSVADYFESSLDGDELTFSVMKRHWALAVQR